MAAYGAVASLVQLLDPRYFPAGHRSNEIESLYEKAVSLQSSFHIILPGRKKADGSEANHDLDNQVRELMYTAQDEIEAFLFRKLNLSDEQGEPAPTLSANLQKIEAAIEPLVEEAAKMAESDAKKKKDLGADDSESIPQPAKERTPIKDMEPVGQEEDMKEMKKHLLSQSSELQVVPITGLPGIGKTTLAQYLYYKDAEIETEFALRAWVTMSQDYQVGEVFSKMLSSMETSSLKGDDKRNEVKADDKRDLATVVSQALYDKKYLVVVDDIWDKKDWDKIKLAFPDKNHGSRIILTTRSKDVAEYAATFKDANASSIHEMQPLNDEYSWMLLDRIVFEPNPHNFEALKEIAIKITQNCGGLPLSLTVIGGLLTQADREDLQYWKGIEEDTGAAFQKGDEAYLHILALSYNHLPRTLKGCFLYIGGFPEDREIPASKLVNLWVAEGFLKPPPLPLPPPPPTPPSTTQTTFKIEEHVARENLERLIDRNLLQVRKVTSNKLMRTCGMHDSLREVATQNCFHEKFFHSRKRYVQVRPEGTNAQRRISVYRNVLMCLEKVRSEVKQIEPARTLIYAGSHHHHPLPFCLTFNLLRVLDAYTVFFLQFPDAISKLIHLRYLSFTYNGKLPASLSNLKKLQILMARRHPRIIFLGASFLPDGLWNMPLLRHLLVTETDLPKIPDAHHKGSTTTTPLFANLQSLSNVSAVTCTEEVIKSMPNLKKLAMWAHKPGRVGLFLNHLQQLESFKFTVLSPDPKSQVEFQPDFYFPDTLIKLRLSGCSLPWEHMEVIEKLPLLEVLKLREVAFKGDEWAPADQFPKLKYLMLEYLDLKIWEADKYSFPELRTLILTHLYQLEGIPEDIGNIASLELIELVDCGPEAVKCAKNIESNSEECGNRLPKVRTYSSCK